MELSLLMIAVRALFLAAALEACTAADSTSPVTADDDSTSGIPTTVELESESVSSQNLQVQVVKALLAVTSFRANITKTFAAALAYALNVDASKVAVVEAIFAAEATFRFPVAVSEATARSAVLDIARLSEDVVTVTATAVAVEANASAQRRLRSSFAASIFEDGLSAAPGGGVAPRRLDDNASSGKTITIGIALDDAQRTRKASASLRDVAALADALQALEPGLNISASDVASPNVALFVRVRAVVPFPADEEAPQLSDAILAFRLAEETGDAVALEEASLELFRARAPADEEEEEEEAAPTEEGAAEYDEASEDEAVAEEAAEEAVLNSGAPPRTFGATLVIVLVLAATLLALLLRSCNKKQAAAAAGGGHVFSDGGVRLSEGLAFLPGMEPACGGDKGAHAV